MKTVFGILSASAALTCLYACTTLSTPEPPDIDLANFTTEGKATKSVETQWGRHELYDPLKDETVKAVFDYVYADGQTRQTIQFDPDIKPYGDFLDNIVEIQKNDLARAGCTTPAFRKCRSDRIEIGDLSSCPKSEFGSPTLNACEASKITRIIAPDEQRPLGYDGSPTLCEFRHKTAVGIGNPANKNSKNDRFNQFFDFDCAFENNSDSSLGDKL